MRIWPANALVVGVVGVFVLAGCSSESPPQRSSASASPTTPAAPAPGSASLVSVAGRCSRRPRSVAVRRAAPGADSRRLDDLGVGQGPEGAAGDVDTGRRAAGLGARSRADPQVDTETRCGAATVDAAGRTRPAARHGIRRFDVVCRRERPDRRIRLRQRRRDQPADSCGRSARRTQPRVERRLRACAEERRRRTQTARCTSRSVRPETSPPRTATPTLRARRSCGFRRAAVAPNRSRRASATGPASPSHPTVRCGRR